MPITRKPIEIPPEAARQFATDMRAYFAEKDVDRRGDIAARTRHMLLQHMPDGTKLRMTEVQAHSRAGRRGHLRCQNQGDDG